MAIYLLIWKTSRSSPLTLWHSLRGVLRLISSREVPYSPLPLVWGIATRYQLNLNFLLERFWISNRGDSDSRLQGDWLVVFREVFLLPPCKG